MNVYNLVSLGGMAVLLGVAWVFSRHRRATNWRVVAWGLGLQLALAVVLGIAAWAYQRLQPRQQPEPQEVVVDDLP